MGQLLKKGDRISIKDVNTANAKELYIGFGWMGDIEIDSFIFIIGNEKKILNWGTSDAESNVVFYNSHCRIAASDYTQKTFKFQSYDLNKYSDYTNYLRYTIPTSPSFEVIGPFWDLEFDDNCDDEYFHLNLSDATTEIFEFKFFLSIYNANETKANFSQLENIYLRIVDRNLNSEILNYHISDHYTKETAIEVGSIYRQNNEWFFQAYGDGDFEGIPAYIKKYLD